MPRGRKRGLNEIPREEFEKIRAERQERLETEFPHGTVVRLRADWIGLKMGTYGFVFVEELGNDLVWRVAFMDGYVTDLSIELDEHVERTGESVEDVDDELERLGPWCGSKRRVPDR